MTATLFKFQTRYGSILLPASTNLVSVQSLKRRSVSTLLLLQLSMDDPFEQSVFHLSSCLPLISLQPPHLLTFLPIPSPFHLSSKNVCGYTNTKLHLLPPLVLVYCLFGKIPSKATNLEKTFKLVFYRTTSLLR